MTARQPRKPRRRVPAPTLPRPHTVQERRRTGESALTPTQSTRREHHIQQDYSYISRDLVAVSIFGAIAFGFIVVMMLLPTW